MYVNSQDTIDTSTARNKHMTIAPILKNWVYKETNNVWGDAEKLCQPFYFLGFKC